MNAWKIAGPSHRTLVQYYSSSTVTLTARPRKALTILPSRPYLPETTDQFTCQDEYVKLLTDNLQSLRTTAKQCRDSNEFKLVSSTNPTTQNIYQPGDLVLFDIRGPQKDFLPTNLTAPFKGPCEVLKHYKNDATCRHLNTGVIQLFHVDRLKPYFGTLASAKELAQADGFKHVVVEITAYRCDPMC
jgi:hypothetical protein